MYFKINLSQSLFYWITYSYIFCLVKLILHLCRLNPYFIGLPILITFSLIQFINLLACLNPYFIGLPILIRADQVSTLLFPKMSQSLFYWITYSYFLFRNWRTQRKGSLNPYFIGLPILIRRMWRLSVTKQIVSILILLDYLFL